MMILNGILASVKHGEKRDTPPISAGSIMFGVKALVTQTQGSVSYIYAIYTNG